MQTAFIPKCLNRPTAITPTTRNRRRNVVIQAKATAYQPPSSTTGATELDALERHSEVSIIYILSLINSSLNPIATVLFYDCCYAYCALKRLLLQNSLLTDPLTHHLYFFLALTPISAGGAGCYAEPGLTNHREIQSCNLFSWYHCRHHGQPHWNWSLQVRH